MTDLVILRGGDEAGLVAEIDRQMRAMYEREESLYQAKHQRRHRE